MRNAIRVAWLAVMTVVLAGCATTSVNTVTNLTASRLPRKDNGQYLFSVEFVTRQRTILKDSMQVWVILGNEEYPMERTRLLASRWETLVPVPANQRVVNYRYRFEYDYKAMPEVRTMVTESQDYQLTVVESW